MDGNFELCLLSAGVTEESRGHLSREEFSKAGTISAVEGMSWQHPQLWSQEDGSCVPCAVLLCVVCLFLVLSSMAEGVQLFTRDRSVKSHKGHLQQSSGLVVEVVVTLGTAFLCTGRAGELLQAFVMFPV